MKMNRWVADLLRVGLLALAFAASAASGFADDEDDQIVLKWRTMAAVQRPYLGAVNPVDGVGGGNAQWEIGRGWGHLKRNGELEIHVRGLVLPEPPFNGVNTVPNFRGLVICRTADAAGNATTVQTFSAAFPASEDGTSDIVTSVSLPTPCIAPTVFVMHPEAPRWFATLGYN